MKRKKYLTKEEKTLDFAIGLVSFFAFNVAIYFFLPYIGIILVAIIGYGLGGTGEFMEQVSICTTFILPCAINIGLLLFCAWWRPWIALGALSALGSLIVLIVLAGVCFFAACLTILTIASLTSST